MSHLDTLNTVQQMVIDFANKNGIDLGSQFESVEAFKDFIVAMTFTELVKAGATPEQALDMVCGEGAFNGLLEKMLAN